jgi:hypothetical protein
MIPEDHVIVLFGATGDLARRKLLPGLFRLSEAGLMPERYRIVAVAGAAGQRGVPWVRPRGAARVRPRRGRRRIEPSRRRGADGGRRRRPCRRLGTPDGHRLAHHGAALVALHDGDFANTAERALASAAASEGVGVVIEAALARVLAGRALAASGSEDAGAEQLEHAAATFERAGALRHRDATSSTCAEWDVACTPALDPGPRSTATALPRSPDASTRSRAS